MTAISSCRFKTERVDKNRVFGLFHIGTRCLMLGALRQRDQKGRGG